MLSSPSRYPLVLTKQDRQSINHSDSCRNSSLDSTHSFAREGNPLREIFAAVGTSLTSLQVVNCNDIFNESALEDLQLLTQLTRLHITNIRQRFPTQGFDSLSCLTGLQVSSTIQESQSLAVSDWQRSLRHVASLQDVTIAGDTDYESVLTIKCLSGFPSPLLALTQLTSLTLASQGGSHDSYAAINSCTYLT